MRNQAFAVLTWLLNLFDPPPLNSMTLAQKTGRIFLFCSTLVIGSILVAMLGAVGLFVMEKGREMDSTPEFLNGLGIIVVGIIVNVICVYVLLHIKKADTKLVPPREK